MPPPSPRRRSVMSEECYARVVDDDNYYLQRMREILEGPPRGKPPVNHVRLWDHIYMGSQRNAEDIEALRRDGIQYVLSCVQARRSTESPYDRSTSGIRGFLLIPAEDREDFDISRYFEGAIKFLDEVRSLQPSGGRALIHCNMGMNRSGAVAAAYLMVAQRRNLLDVIADMKAKRNALLSNRGFRRQLVEFARSRGLLDPIVDTVTRITYGNPTIRTRSREKSENIEVEASKSNSSESASNGGSGNGRRTTREGRRVEKRSFVSSEATGTSSDDEVTRDNNKIRSESYDESRDTVHPELIKSASFDERQRVHPRSSRYERSLDRGTKEISDSPVTGIDNHNKTDVKKESDIQGMVIDSNNVQSFKQINVNITENCHPIKRDGTSNNKNQARNIKIHYETNEMMPISNSSKDQQHESIASKNHISSELIPQKPDNTEPIKRRETIMTRNLSTLEPSLDTQRPKSNRDASVDEGKNLEISTLPAGSVMDGRFSLTNTIIMPVQHQTRTSPRTRRSTITLGTAAAPAVTNRAAMHPAVRSSVALTMPAVTIPTTASSKVQVATVTTPVVTTTTLHLVSQTKPSVVRKATVTTPEVKTTTLQLVSHEPLQHTVRPAAVEQSAVQRAITLALVRPVAIGLAAVKPTTTGPGAAKRSGQWLNAVKQVAAASATAVSQVAKPIAAGLIPVRLAALKLSASKGSSVVTQAPVKPSSVSSTLMPATLVKTAAVYQTAITKPTTIKSAVARSEINVGTPVIKTSNVTTLTSATKDLSNLDKRKTSHASTTMFGKVKTTNGDVQTAKKTSQGCVEVPIKLTNMLHEVKPQSTQSSPGKTSSDSTIVSKEAPVLRKAQLVRGLSFPSETPVTKKVPVVIKVPVINIPPVKGSMSSSDRLGASDTNDKRLMLLNLEPVVRDQKSKDTLNKPLEQIKTTGTEIHLVPASNNSIQSTATGTSRAAFLLKPPTPPSDLLREPITPLEIPNEDKTTDRRERVSPGWYSSYTDSLGRAPLGTSSLGRPTMNTMNTKRLMPLQVSNTSSLGRNSHHLDEPLTEPKRCSSASDRFIEPVKDEDNWGGYNSTGRPNSWATVSSYDRPIYPETQRTDSNISPRRMGFEKDTTPGYRSMTDSGRHLVTDLGISNTARNRWFSGLDSSPNVPPYRLFSKSSNIRDNHIYPTNLTPWSTSITSESQPYHESSPVSHIPINRVNDSFRQGGAISTRNSVFNEVDTNDRFGRNSFHLQKGEAGISEIDVKPMSNIQFHSMLRAPRTSAAFSSDPSEGSQYSGFLVLLGTRRGVAGSVADLTMPSESTNMSPWKSAASQWNRTPINFNTMTTSFESSRSPSNTLYDGTSSLATTTTPRTPRAYTRSRTDSEILRERRL